ncbi:hypothetical protein [Tomitella gaofuii]|uniref:hypothetical protein n=1 Tax=Tomitella gaofuii TaxID=2760083 RepID=UPI0015FA1CB1|nr:hypothetical protein [Tomitella gaofuii]
MKTYAVRVNSDAHGWTLEVPALGRAAFARNIRDVDGKSTDLICAATGLGAADIALDITWPAPIMDALHRIDEARRHRRRAQETEAQTLRDGIRELRECGATFRDVGALVGLSHQRVHQLAEG